MEFLFCFVLVWFVGYRLERRARRKKFREEQSCVKLKGRDRRMLVDSFDDGIYEVGVDIAPGTYRALGRPPLETIWHRLRDFSGTEAGMIARGVVVGPCIVTIAATDRGFESIHSGGWKRISRV